MRFAITASDRFKGVLDACLQAGWEPIKMFCTPVDDRMHFNKTVQDIAGKRGVPLQISPMTVGDLADLAERGCDALIVASYNWRIPDWQPFLKYAVNFHPSPLPVGRGPYPAVRAILDGHESWGCSCHQLSLQLDAGNLLAQEIFPLTPDETHQTLDFKIQMALCRLGLRVALNFESLWQEARPQPDGGSYWPLWTEQDRMLDFTRSLKALERQLRAFGDFECLACVNGVNIFVHRAEGWQETHGYAPGTVVHHYGNSLLLAVADGMLLIREWSLHGPDTITGRLRV